MQGINNLFNSMKQIFECNYMYMYSIYTNSFNNITSSTISWIFYSHQPLLVSFWFCYPWRNYHNHWDTPRGELPRACRERIISYLSQAQWKVGSYSKVTTTWCCCSFFFKHEKVSLFPASFSIGTGTKKHGDCRFFRHFWGSQLFQASCQVLACAPETLPASTCRLHKKNGSGCQKICNHHQSSTSWLSNL